MHYINYLLAYLLSYIKHNYSKHNSREAIQVWPENKQKKLKWLTQKWNVLVVVLTVAAVPILALVELLTVGWLQVTSCNKKHDKTKQNLQSLLPGQYRWDETGRPDDHHHDDQLQPGCLHGRHGKLGSPWQLIRTWVECFLSLHSRCQMSAQNSSDPNDLLLPESETHTHATNLISIFHVKQLVDICSSSYNHLRLKLED